MNFYDCMQIENWQNLDEEAQVEVFEALVKYTVNPKLPVTDQRLVTFEMTGFRCKTFEFLIAGEEFVFIPGKRHVTLGWDNGLKGLRLEDVINEKLGEDSADVKRYQNNLSALLMSKKEQEFLFDFENMLANYVTQIENELLDKISPERKVDIPPMIVAKKSQPVGTRYQGKYQIVAGEFFGNDEFWHQYQEDIQEDLHPQLTLAESLTWEFPRQLVQMEQYYLEQSIDMESYYVYEHHSQTFSDVLLSLHRQGFQLLSEDSWEFAIGAGSRRLFRWGNEIDLMGQHPFTSARKKITQANMFGLDFSNYYQSFELTEQNDVLKMDREPLNHLGTVGKIISASSYYRPEQQVKPSEELSPLGYRYRKSIVINRD